MTPQNYLLINLSQLSYLIICIAAALWVGRTLFSKSAIFLLGAFEFKKDVASSVSRLLEVGFYLLTIGFIGLYLAYSEYPNSPAEAIEYVATNTGVVMVVLGVVHLFNVLNFTKLRQRHAHMGSVSLADAEVFEEEAE